MKTLRKIIISLLVLYFVSYSVFLLYSGYRLKHYGACTIGEVTGFSVTSKSHENLIYKYSIENKIYINGYGGYKESYLGNKYIVRYDKSNPERSVIYLESPIEGELGETINECKDEDLFIMVFHTAWNVFGKY